MERSVSNTFESGLIAAQCNGVILKLPLVFFVTDVDL